MKFGLRVTLLGLAFTALFSVLFIRLWFVQIAEGQVFAEQAEDQILTFEFAAAPRGDIVDRNGVTLVTSRSLIVAVVDRSELDEQTEDDVIQRLAALLGVPPIEIRSELERAGSGAVARLDDFEIDPQTAYVILERSLDLPGVTVEAVPVREYLREDLMAHVLGYVGLPSPADLEDNPDLNPSVVVGKMGVEREYDEFLQGTEGSTAFLQNPSGLVLQELNELDAEPGATLMLSLDINTQRIVQDILQESVVLANLLKADETEEERTLPAERAAAVVIEADTGAVTAMASFPSFEPQAFVGGISGEEFDVLLENFAFNNLVIQGLKPPASTFKAITYVTALQESIFPEGIRTAEEAIQCSAQLEALDLGDASQLVYNNWTSPLDDGLQNLHRAFERSCNIYFWELALSIWRQFKETEDEDILQDWAFELGFGRRTQVDLPFENSGILPDRELFDLWKFEQPWRVRKEGWLGGDLMNLSVGQGEVLATPLQVATAYAAMVNGGTVFQPRVVDSIVTADGDIVRGYEPRPIRTPDLNAVTVNSLRQDMKAVVSTGTASAAFSGSGLSGIVGGKTGTAQGFVDQDGVRHDSTAWFVGAAPIDDPKYIVVVMVDEGGSGGSVAAPAARAIFQHLMGMQVELPLTPGAETD